jgi:spermidine/putrescine transport system ATP-binding protein
MLEVRDIYKDYEGKPLLKGVSLAIGSGETVCLLGSSGSGKSTLLRIIAGLETCDRGQVLWDGEDLAPVPVHRRNFGLMFQDYALFPHRSVAENVAFGLRMQSLPDEAVALRVNEVLDRVNMLAFARRRVTDLSGGEQQRVALARAIAPRPRLLMLDEPLGALDRALRTQLIDELRRLLRDEKIPAIYVTHDQDEAFAIADRLALLHEGQVVQEGTPAGVYAHPRSVWVATFLGMGNLIPGKIVQADPLLVETVQGCFEAGSSQPGTDRPGTEVSLLLRPHLAEGVKLNTSATQNYLSGVVTDVVFYGDGFRVVIRARDSKDFQFLLKETVSLGENVQFFIPPQSILCL